MLLISILCQRWERIFLQRNQLNNATRDEVGINVYIYIDFEAHQK